MPSQFKQKRVCRDREASLGVSATLGKRYRCNVQTCRFMRPHQTCNSTATNLLSRRACAIRYPTSACVCYQGGLLQSPLKWVLQHIRTYPATKTYLDLS